MSIFMSIIEGKIPSYKIYEDEWVYSFLALDQITKGHTLIIPKINIDHFTDVPEPYYSKVFTAAKEISIALQKSMNCKRVGTMIQGWEVPHFHYHLVPMHKVSDLSFKQAKQYSKEEMIEIQESILRNLR